MNIDMKKALSFVSQDKDWVNKLFAGAGIMLLSYTALVIPFLAVVFEKWSAVIILSIVALVIFAIGQFAILGYGCEVVQKYTVNPQETVLPDWNNFSGLVNLGFKYSVGAVLFMLPLIVLYLAGLFIVATLGAFQSSYSAFFVTLVILMILAATGLAFYLFVLVFFPLFSANFMKELKILSFVNPKQSFGRLKAHALDYTVLYIFYIALMLVVGVVASLLTFTIIGILFLPALYLYGYLVYTQLCAQFINLSDNHLPQDEQNQDTLAQG